MEKRVVIAGVLQGPKANLEFDSDFLKTFLAGQEVILKAMQKKTPVMVTGVSNKPRMYLGTALENQSIN